MLKKIILILFLTNFAFYSFAQDNRSAALILNYDTGKILYNENASSLRNPASLVKMMTIYLAFEQVKNGKMSFKTQLKVSEKAAKSPRTNINLKAGSTISLIDAILALIVHSANDAAVVIAENIAKSEYEFAKIMTEKAKALGMNNTNYVNASGLHHSDQKTTAFDLVKLSVALKKHFPDYYHLFSRNKFTYGGVVYKSHNRVTNNNQWADGIKTGFTNASGFNLATSGRKGDVRLVGVVLGGVSSKARDDKMVNLMNRCFSIERNEAPDILAQELAPKKKKLIKQKKNKKKIVQYAKLKRHKKSK